MASLSERDAKPKVICNTLYRFFCSLPSSWAFVSSTMNLNAWTTLFTGQFESHPPRITNYYYASMANARFAVFRFSFQSQSMVILFITHNGQTQAVMKRKSDAHEGSHSHSHRHRRRQQLIVLPHNGSDFYLKSAIHTRCSDRTQPTKWHPEDSHQPISLALCAIIAVILGIRDSKSHASYVIFNII